MRIVFLFLAAAALGVVQAGETPPPVTSGEFGGRRSGIGNMMRNMRDTVVDTAASEGIGSGNTYVESGDVITDYEYVMEEPTPVVPGGAVAAPTPYLRSGMSAAQQNLNNAVAGGASLGNDGNSGGDPRNAGQGQEQEKPKTMPLVRSDEYYRNLYFPPEREVPLSKREQWILDKVNEGKDNGFNSNPMYMPDGTVQYVYGTSMPSILCAPLQLTDIELEPGEILNSLNVGDPARWQFEAALSSSAGGDIQHVILKPMDIGITTSMVIATNRRTYNLRLKATQEDFFPKVSFAYPDNVLLKGQIAKAKVEKERAENTLEGTGEYLGGLSFEYKISATRRAMSMKPVRVYNDGVKTILEMPKVMTTGEMPVLLVVSSDGRGNPFRKTETTLINYRVQSNRFIVDGLFDMAYLVKGVGSVQDRVTIERVQKGR